jgi:hypothetical protein
VRGRRRAPGLYVRPHDRRGGLGRDRLLKEHYDVAERHRRRWPKLRRDLDGKIYLTVGRHFLS